MKKPEAALTPFINRWMAHVTPQSCPWEIKHTRGKENFLMSELTHEKRIHEYHSLVASTTKIGFTKKLPDLGAYNPFDTIHYKNGPAYVVIIYPKLIIAIHVLKIDIELKNIPFSAALAMQDFIIEEGRVKTDYKYIKRDDE